MAGIALVACGTEKTEAVVTATPVETEPVKQFVLDKLVGTWQSEDGSSFERWAKNSDGTYRSVVYQLKGSDTIFNEQANIYEENGKWVFENKVNGQNEGKTVKFTAGIVSENTIQFSNPEHDFPNDINYTLPDNDVVNAFIVGRNQKGGFDTIPFNYKRFK
ncbi:MAG: hypothetical protein K0S33_2901 [Bacteroidetes bacterium]|nr:hypothetical protein [Bacteroidota bacterium]